MNALDRRLLELLCQRLKRREIAQRLNMPPGTLQSHLRRLYRKLDAHSRMEVLLKAGLLRYSTNDPNG